MHTLKWIAISISEQRLAYFSTYGWQIRCLLEPNPNTLSCAGSLFNRNPSHNWTFQYKNNIYNNRRIAPYSINSCNDRKEGVEKSKDMQASDSQRILHKGDLESRHGGQTHWCEKRDCNLWIMRAYRDKPNLNSGKWRLNGECWQSGMRIQGIRAQEKWGKVPRLYRVGSNLNRRFL